MKNTENQITIKDVAAACGVSIATVSLALRNHPRISSETKKIVHDTTEQLGYRRNPLVSALMSNVSRSSKIHFPIPLAAIYNGVREQVESSAYHRRLWDGIVQRAKETGFSVEPFFLRDKKVASSRRLSEILYARNITGVLIPPLAFGGGHLSLDWEKISALAIGHSMLKPTLHRVCPDQYQGIRMALHHIRRKGYLRPGLIIAGHGSARTLRRWSSGFYGQEYAQKKRGIIPVLECGEVDLKQLLVWYKKYKPDIIISSGIDRLVWKALQQTEIRIPEETAFVTLSRSGAESLVAGVNENENLVGRAAVDQLARLLYNNERGIPKHPTVTQIAPAWEDGATCPCKKTGTKN
ncbi:MAG: LacI family DNA-binding transcriptional regulator [Kiritimatiellales bacterium]